MIHTKCCFVFIYKKFFKFSIKLCFYCSFHSFLLFLSLILCKILIVFEFEMNSNVFCEEKMILDVIVSKHYYSKHIQTIEVFISEIKIKTKISEIVAFLSKKFVFKDLKHLKRVNTNFKSNDNCFQIIVCINNEINEKILKEINDFMVENDLLPLRTGAVPKYAPITQTQYELSAKLWPVSYHPNKYLEKCLNSSLFDENERKMIFKNILKTIELNEKTSMSAMVCDSTHHMITICESEVKSNPLRHAVIVAIDRVSETQRSEENSVNNDSYLCSGLQFYTSCEPCIMCAMALIHSRVKRLFFYESKSKDTAPECNDRSITLHNFHLLPKLNHHFECWRITFK